MVSFKKALERMGIQKSLPINDVDVGDIEADKIDDLLFSGTGKTFYNSVMTGHGGFKKDTGEVYLTHYLPTAINYAKERSSEHGDTPIVIVVSSRDPKLFVRPSTKRPGLIVDDIPRDSILEVFNVSGIKDSDFVDMASNRDVYQMVKDRCERI